MGEHVSFIDTNIKNKLTDLCGNSLLQNDLIGSFCEIISTDYFLLELIIATALREEPDAVLPSPNPQNSGVAWTVLLSTDDMFQETSARCKAVEPEQWLQRHPEAGSSWSSWSQASQRFAFASSALREEPDAVLPNLISHKVFIKSFSKIQFPHKSVNLFFILVIVKDKLTNLYGN